MGYEERHELEYCCDYLQGTDTGSTGRHFTHLYSQFDTGHDPEVDT